MANPFIAEIRAFPFNFAPAGWASCNGQLLPIASNVALFSLLAAYYGGNGVTHFALPNLQGNMPVGAGQAPGLSYYGLGEQGDMMPYLVLNFCISLQGIYPARV
ncbi:MAG TPA: tail fiber protein [Bryobacteraceae bacterium]|nr:tail fiber protein [Bryobacteraceae bacterium]